jgi:nicotinate-nucleotide pyrophosphorylase (carboxylating)
VTLSPDEPLPGDEVPVAFLGLDLAEVQRIVLTALTEDLGEPARDVTSESTIPAAQTDTAELVARADGVVAGLLVAAEVFATTR